MHDQRNSLTLTRRGAIVLAAGSGFAAWSHLYAFGKPEFWNKKDPAEWSVEEIHRITTHSPWAKDVSAQFERDEPPSGSPTGGGGGGGGRPSIGGIPGIGGIGGGRGGMGGGRGGMGRGRSGSPVSLHGTVRWESAKLILDALKTPLSPEFAGHYAIRVIGMPLMAEHRRRSQSGDDTPQPSTQDIEERLKQLTLLQPKNKASAGPDIVQPGPNGESILFGFLKETVPLSLDDKEVTFYTRFGRMDVKTKFNLKDMTYHGELAI